MLSEFCQIKCKLSIGECESISIIYRFKYLSILLVSYWDLLQYSDTRSLLPVRKDMFVRTVGS